MNFRVFWPAAAAVLCFLTPAFAAAAEDDIAEVASYRMTIEAARKVDAATRAMQKAFVEAGDEDPEIFAEGASLDELEANLNDNEIAATALRSAGISAREYLRFIACWAQTSMLVSFLHEGTIAELPEEILPENVSFLEDNADELEAMTAGWDL